MNDEFDKSTEVNEEEQQEAPRAFYARFYFGLNIVLIALLALLWILNARCAR